LGKLITLNLYDPGIIGLEGSMPTTIELNQIIRDREAEILQLQGIVSDYGVQIQRLTLELNAFKEL